MENYIPVLILMGVGAALAGIILGLSRVCGPRRPNILKDDVYECGVPPVGDAQRRMSVKFYLIAILFLLFDVEAIFFIPWAIVFKKYLTINAFILIEMIIFVVVLLVGYLYILKKGALKWD